MWRYLQASGELTDEHGDLIGQGYSGSPVGRNIPALQDVHDVGPIPRGTWTITAPADTETHGPYVLGLVPTADTQTFGRDGFRIHGERKDQVPGDASTGCIILRRPVREALWASGDHVLQVI